MILLKLKYKNRAMSKIYLGLGSNVNDRITFINSAIKHVNKLSGCKVEQVSSFYESFPYGKTNQGNFINTVITVKTSIAPLDLFRLLKDIEIKTGRKQRGRWGPREIDIDILFYDNLILESNELTIPHNDLHNRGFVLMPLIELEPDIIHPKSKKLLKEYLDTNKENHILKIWKNNFVKF